MTGITVPASFIKDFNLVMERTNTPPREADALRPVIRADFERLSVWVTETAALYRFADATWGGLPTPELCRGYMAACSHWPEDDTVFKRWGIMLLVRECMRLAPAYRVVANRTASPQLQAA